MGIFPNKTVFISHRRTEQANAQALHIFHGLKNQGFNVFLDIQSQMPVDYRKVLEHFILDFDHFIVVLNPGDLDRCLEANDFVRREISVAINAKRNIIPVYCNGFDFKSVPKNVIDPCFSPELCKLQFYNGVQADFIYFHRASIGYIEERLNYSLDQIVSLHPGDEGCAC